MDKSKDKRDGGFPPTPRDHEPWLNEGGTARYPEGHKMRGHDINALLDRADGAPEKDAAEEPAAE